MPTQAWAELPNRYAVVIVASVYFLRVYPLCPHKQSYLDIRPATVPPAGSAVDSETIVLGLAPSISNAFINTLLPIGVSTNSTSP